MRVSDFDYSLPDELIARFPVSERTGSRLLQLDGPTGQIVHSSFVAVEQLLRPGDLLVMNNTRVIPARLFGRKESGGRLEVLVERILGECRILAHVRASKSPKVGSRLLLAEDRVEATVAGRQGALFVLVFSEPVLKLIEQYGHMPLPHYMRRDDGALDRERYQTVFAERDGAVAAPTAGLHFDRPLLERLRRRHVQQAFVTLHVGSGTFQPVRSEQVEQHVMHSEFVEVSESVCEAVRQTRQRGGRVIAVGTTAVRSLESASNGGEIRPFSGDTDIFIYPGYRFRSVDALITNFHLPQSTLLMLVSAFAGRESVLSAYREAVTMKYRFFSYGDAMWLTRKTGCDHASSSDGGSYSLK